MCYRGQGKLVYSFIISEGENVKMLSVPHSLISEY